MFNLGSDGLQPCPDETDTGSNGHTSDSNAGTMVMWEDGVGQKQTDDCKWAKILHRYTFRA